MSQSPLKSPRFQRQLEEGGGENVTEGIASPQPLQHPSPTSRPPLQRLPASTLIPSPSSLKSPVAGGAPSVPYTHEEQDQDQETEKSEVSESAGEGETSQSELEEEDAPQDRPSPDEIEIERLRQLQLKILQQQHQQQHHQQQQHQHQHQQQQQHARLRKAKSASAPTSPIDGTLLTMARRRVSPIKEETLSPTLEGAFSSPLPTGETHSTESTESTRTIRASVPPTPSGHPLRTPSYPFPTVPNTPKGWPASFHQPFTTLSPTANTMYHMDHPTPRDRIVADPDTPAASSTPFAPPGRPSTVPQEDPRFPTPNLYDLVLLLSTEPGLKAWWTTVTVILHDWYGAERATISVPADSSDLENVPWGQKTTFNVSSHVSGPPMPPSAEKGKEKPQPERTEPESPQEPRPADIEREQTASPAVSERRPHLAARHSFAGHERQSRDASAESRQAATPMRPRGPLRTASYIPQSTPRSSHPLRQVSPVSFDGTSQSTPTHEHTFSDPEFSAIGDNPSVLPQLAVFPVLRALDHEPEALIDNAGIIRVVERGRLVTLTRDYSPSLGVSRKNSMSSEHGEDNTTSKAKHVSIAPPEGPKTPSGRNNTGAKKSGNLEQTALRTHYEEYEQFPTSPWAQSPAPSPAIQTDPEQNPFFENTDVVEETFSPSGSSSQDYSQFNQVEAIGVDKAHTITHLPLIHPTVSLPIHTHSTRLAEGAESSQDTSEDVTPSAKGPDSRKPPIAILSILSSIVPYPHNLTHSLKLLGPHLATTFSNAWAYTNAHAQAVGIRHRRYLSGHQMGFAPMSDQESLDELLHLDLENISGSAAGSVTSPSDYSGRSKHSPGGSLGGTPGWDPTSMGFTSSRHSVGSTPGHLVGVEAVESYFDAKKKSSNQSQDHGPNRRADKRAKRTSIGRVPENVEEDVTSRSEKAGQRPVAYDDTPAQRKHRPTGLQPAQAGTEPRQHSLLHSYGADFSSSFQGLPAATTPGARTPAATPGARSGSAVEALDMPPPSESLLRTIIDSLPVQIFTALPTTGALTWVNSKFLVYRGQDSRQVLQDPWDSIHPDDRDDYLEQWNKSLRTGQQLQKKVRLQRFDGHYRWFYVRVAPLKNKRQQIVHWIGTNMDFHDQHLAEANSARQQETAASEAKYRALANSSPQVVFVVSNRRGLTFCNLQWKSYSGQTEAQAHGTGFLEHVHPDDVIKCKLPEMSEDGSMSINVPTSMPPDSSRDSPVPSDASSETDKTELEKTVTSPGSSSPQTMEMPQAKLSKLASTGILRVTRDADGRASYSTEVRLRSKEGEYRWHLVRVLLEKSLASTDDKDEETWYGTATDINDHKLLEQTLKETMDAKTRFLSNMSHEIRTPLNGVSGMVNFLLDSTLNPEQLEHVNIIKASTDSLLSLINDILDLSKVEAGMIKLSMDWLHIPSLLEEVNDLNMGLALQKGLELNYIVEEGVPSMVKGDKFRIRQVLLNVVGNAIKFTQKGEVFVRCRSCQQDRAQMQDNELMVRFEVIDTGRGFSEDEAKYLFKRFSQIDASSTRQHGGTGLGLAISMQFVELHGGKMDARSAPGKGSTFFFTIKFQLPSEQDQPPQEALTPAAVELVVPPVQSTSQLSSMQKFASINAGTAAQAENPTGEFTEGAELVQSPAPSLPSSERSRESPSVSSAGSDPSIYTSTGRSSIRSERSSASSYIPEGSQIKASQIKLALPTKRGSEDDSSPDKSTGTKRSDAKQQSLPLPGNVPATPPMYSILIVCPLIYSKEATTRHIKNTLPENVPHQITTKSSLAEAQELIGGDDPVLFTHVVLVLHEYSDVITIMDQIFASPAHSSTSIVVISDPTHKREVMHHAPGYDYDRLVEERRLRFIYRPLKPSKFAVIFDPQKEREMSTDRNQDSAQQVAVTQKLVFEEVKRRCGNKGHRVLLVEDNHINQTVILKFLAKIAIDTETVLDGVQCTERVFSMPPGYYSIILCDLHMPNKDGYQACKEIRRWERKNGHRRHPIVALSANVLGDVYAKCVEAGFNSYVTKPVEFKELSFIMTKFLDPSDPSKPPELMKARKH